MLKTYLRHGGSLRCSCYLVAVGEEGSDMPSYEGLQHLLCLAQKLYCHVLNYAVHIYLEHSVMFGAYVIAGLPRSLSAEGRRLAARPHA